MNGGRNKHALLAVALPSSMDCQHVRTLEKISRSSTLKLPLVVPEGVEGAFEALRPLAAEKMRLRPFPTLAAALTKLSTCRAEQAVSKGPMMDPNDIDTTLIGNSE